MAAEYESFREASERLHVTASAVSHQIKNLESELGISLFDRRSRSLRLTSKGEALYADIHPLIREIDGVASQHAESPSRETLRMSVQPFFASQLLVPRLPELQDLYTDVDIEIDTSLDATEKQPTADILIRLFRKPPSSLESRSLFALRLIPVGSAPFYDTVKLRGKKITSAFPLIVHEHRASAWRQWERSSGVSIPKGQKVMRLDSMSAVLMAAEQGLGAALVPIKLSASYIETGKVVPLFDHELVTQEGYYVVWRNDDHREDIDTARDWLLQNFGDAA